MEDFYRWQRKRLGYLMDGDKPVGGEWNFDKDNREPPPRTDTNRWPQPLVTPLDNVDNEVLASLPSSCWGAPPTGLWATSRKHALQRLDHFITQVLPSFGPHEDAMLSDNWHLAHSLLSPYLNNGLLLPAELCDAAEAAYKKGPSPQSFSFPPKASLPKYQYRLPFEPRFLGKRLQSPPYLWQHPGSFWGNVSPTT